MNGISRLFAAVAVAVLAAGCAATPAGAPRATPATGESPLPARVGQVVDINPDQAYRLLQDHPTAVLLDVRTQAEYVFVGHPEKALNIPYEYWDEATYQWSDNPRFEEKVRARIGKGVAVIVLCRSGNRSRKVAELLVALGYARVYNMVESFEGAADPVTKLRTVDGWRNRGLPYTYDLDRNLMYWP